MPDSDTDWGPFELDMPATDKAWEMFTFLESFPRFFRIKFTDPATGKLAISPYTPEEYFYYALTFCESLIQGGMARLLAHPAEDRAIMYRCMKVFRLGAFVTDALDAEIALDEAGQWMPSTQSVASGIILDRYDLNYLREFQQHATPPIYEFFKRTPSLRRYHYNKMRVWHLDFRGKWDNSICNDPNEWTDEKLLEAEKWWDRIRATRPESTIPSPPEVWDF